jgi:predicted dehydrogenase
VRKQKEPATSGKEALGVMKIMDAMYESASTGKEVEVSG